MLSAFFVSDLHGSLRRYDALFGAIAREAPEAVFLGGDLLPHPAAPAAPGFAERVLADGFRSLRETLGERFPRILLILGNDDPRAIEDELHDCEREGLCEYIHGRRVGLGRYEVAGYSFVPPTPFLLKDWERYDVSRYVDPGCVSPEEGRRSVTVEPEEIRFSTIRDDLERLAAGMDPDRTILLAHGPPHDTMLDRAALDGKMIDWVPLDLHVGSVALRRFIETRQPRLTLHGHIHESARLTGSWRDRIGRTEMLSAAHDGEELALVRLDLDDPASATRELL